MEKASTILKKSLKFFGPKGQRWYQGDFSNRRTGKHKKLCLIGAIFEFGNTRFGRLAARHAIYEATGIDGPATWQDDPKRKFSEVKAAFLKAIKLAEQQEKGRTRSVRK